jgi:hypothetical protein
MFMCEGKVHVLNECALWSEPICGRTFSSSHTAATES